MGSDTYPIWMRNGIKESMTLAFSGKLNPKARLCLDKEGGGAVMRRHVNEQLPYGAHVLRARAQYWDKVVLAFVDAATYVADHLAQGAAFQFWL